MRLFIAAFIAAFLMPGTAQADKAKVEVCVGRPDDSVCWTHETREQLPEFYCRVALEQLTPALERLGYRVMKTDCERSPPERRES